MTWTKDQIAPYLGQQISEWRSSQLHERGKKYLGRDVPDEYFKIQDFCAAQGTSQDSLVPDLTVTLQGVEYIIQAGTGKHPEMLTQETLRQTMSYLNREDLFERGALRQYPNFLEIVKEELVKLPSGKTVLDMLGQIPEYQDLFGNL
ncbi:MAG: hypothetical protein A3A65_00200 [Candidatus Chisholmbacteria bacterium RIFCSPLOWO2_01_FULL_49_14]|uniref:Uncharacterized protein n=1 Tax=Candidatus Chisholmbacteria bacterium RIFCSPLOWO2_01_FULL_49_14 TaxID=1797593 RepID=A0A1G1W171_9BACT|nr:MAG: hypothetical protein A3A65_00200 [Candidatus Chisholmbacteria bacterium RIFCSPLOWO2_01_FULL_49_14]